MTIIGVMPNDFRFLRVDPAVWLPFQFDRSEVYVGDFSYQGVSRLAFPFSNDEHSFQGVSKIQCFVFDHPGIGGALALTRTMESLLFGVVPTDPGMFATVPLVLGGVALLATSLPAMRSDPVTALRAD